MTRPEPSRAAGREPVRSGPVPPSQGVPVPVPVPLPVPLLEGPVPPARGLDGSFARGLAWTSAARWGSQLVSWVSTFLVARLLVPEVLVRRDHFAVIRPRPSFDDMLARDNVPEWI